MNLVTAETESLLLSAFSLSIYTTVNACIHIRYVPGTHTLAAYSEVAVLPGCLPISVIFQAQLRAIAVQQIVLGIHWHKPLKLLGGHPAVVEKLRGRMQHYV